MRRLARFAVALAAAALFPSAASAATERPDQCAAQGTDLARGVEIVEAVRASTASDGSSKVDIVQLKGATASFMGGSVKLTQFDLGNPTKVALVYGFPNIAIPIHPAPYREIFIILSGTSEIVMPDGKVHPLKAGSMFISEDVGAKGRAGRAGPCGYVALDLQYKDAAAPLPLPYQK